MTAYFNEFAPFPAQWLRNLTAAGHIAQGYVDERSIKEVKPDDLIGYDQCHFFAGIGVWSYALQLAGWPDDREVWTGSCPCQPFSAAGKRGGTDDPRHLWPDWFKLIRERRPPVIFGEQVASKDGLAWLDLVYADLEGAGYAVAAVDLCAASVGAPHIRQRLYFVAHAVSGGKQALGSLQQEFHAEGSGQPDFMAGPASGEQWRLRQSGTWEIGDKLPNRGCSTIGKLAHAYGGNSGAEREQRGREQRLQPEGGGIIKLGDTGGTGLQGNEHPGTSDTGDAGQQTSGSIAQPGSAGYWSNLEWLQCRDGKARPTQPGLFPLAHGATARVGRLRAYGNAIVGPLAAEFIKAYMEIDP